MQLIYTLVEQIGGDLQVSGQTGTRITVLFTDPEAVLVPEPEYA